MAHEFPIRQSSPLTGDPRSWRSAIAPYQQPDLRASVWQIVTTVPPYIALLALMYWSPWLPLTLALSVLAAGFLVRIFIIFHDCCHGSFFRSRRANQIVGAVAGFFVFTPFHKWRHEHAIHHATTGDLDRRGHGDFYTMTVAEYRAATPIRQLRYRLYRHPLIFLGVGPIYTFLIGNRFPGPEDGPRERRSILLMNLALAIYALAMIATIGLPALLLIQLPTLALAATAGVWLFYVQHQFEDAYWTRGDGWDFAEASLHGSTYLKLPRLLQWFSGNIGFHHIHHLSARIPNYRLEACHRASPELQCAPTITLRDTLRLLALSLWDEQSQQLISFRTEAAARAAGGEQRTPA